MHIKEMSIAGFKSYRQKTIIAQFDKRHNVVVGRNGSGKSNFFAGKLMSKLHADPVWHVVYNSEDSLPVTTDTIKFAACITGRANCFIVPAIEFVLSNEYNNLRLEQRKGLMCQVKASDVNSAFVEIVFDNSEMHIPIMKKEVPIRRTITASKDQYTLDGKQVARKEVVQFLEMAGLSNANPYYIVKQGKIAQLTTAKPPQLLQVLFEVSGIRIYHEHREISLKRLRQTEEEMTSVLTSRDGLVKLVDTLLQEKGELERYEQLDRKRRVLEFVTLDKEKAALAGELETLGQARDKWKEMGRLLGKQKAEIQQQVGIVRKELKHVQGMLTKEMDQSRRSSSYPVEHLRLVKQKTHLELKVEDMERELAAETQRRAHVEEQLDKLNRQIGEQEVRLEDASRRCVELHHREDTLTAELRQKEQQRGEYLKKQGRAVQFATRSDRDGWLREEIASLQQQMQSSAGQMVQLGSKLADLKAYVVDEQRYKTNHDALWRMLAAKIDKYRTTVGERKAYRDDCIWRQQSLWDTEGTIQQQLATHRDELREVQQSLRKHTPSVQLVIGGDSVRKVIDAFGALGPEKQHVVNGYYGQLVDNFECDEAIYRAVETAAGSKLFYHVVASDAVAKEIVQAYNNQRLPGTFQFMPLNRLQRNACHYPATDDRYAIPLISLLKYEKKYELAMQMVFGRTLLCTDLDAMPDAAKRAGLSCVTYDGDQLTQGVLRGGYHAKKQSLLELHRRRKCTEQALVTLGAELALVHEDLRQTEVDVGACESELSQLDAKLQKLLAALESERNRKRLLPEQMRKHADDCETLERKIRVVQCEHELMKEREASLYAELDQELPTAGQLSAEDQRTIEELDGDIRTLRQQQQEAFTCALEATKTKHKLKNLLHSNLLPKRDEVARMLDGAAVEGRVGELERLRKQIDATVAKIATLLNEMAEHDRKIDTITEQRDSVQKRLDVWLGKLHKIEEKIAANPNPDALADDAHRQSLETRREECLRKINDLGALPAIDPVYFALPLHRLVNDLEKTKKQLKQVSNCNKRALDEYGRQSQLLDETNQRIAELRTAEESIRTSFENLKMRREECIQTTYREVNKHFREIFRRFVPAGEGRLCLQTRDTGMGTEPSNDADTERYTGLGLEVSFVGGKAIMSEMHQLSGGQKTMVAIALILAIQRYKPAPFYLFDEIDQALDSNYRKSVAELIHELSERSQFITTTFRRELLKHANKFYGVRCRNRVSHIDAITQRQAYEFVVDDKVNK